jgi:hypothetical protein
MGEYVRQNQSINIYASKERNWDRITGGGSSDEGLMSKSVKERL